ncbi:magnesium transporter NIPA [Toxoplasma gondii VAND]|uniref:Magnesium transporter NIPA n=1 Tax=Toxoplasma gondii VAND TaxID=933077 RepID=A0A086PP59_TOXGO|nr:magnesium transporter NIPA [Toxoplasma gondii VAND]
MWQLGIAFAAVASFCGAAGDALVRLSFVVERKRLASYRREERRRAKGGNEEEAKPNKTGGAVRTNHSRAEKSRSTREKKQSISCLQDPASTRFSPGKKTELADKRETFETSEKCRKGDDRRETPNVLGRGKKGVIQKLTACSATGRRPLYLRPLWIIGTCLGTVINSLLSIISLDFATAAIVTPFAGLHIFWNVILSRFVLQEQVLPQHYIGSALILLGLLLVLCFGVHTPPPLSLEQLLRLYSQNTCVFYFFLSILCISFCIFVALVGRDFPESVSHSPFSSVTSCRSPAHSKRRTLELHVLAGPALSFSSPIPSLFASQNETDRKKTSSASCPSPRDHKPVASSVYVSSDVEDRSLAPPLSSFLFSPPSLPFSGQRHLRGLFAVGGKRETSFSEGEEDSRWGEEDSRERKDQRFPPKRPRETGDSLVLQGDTMQMHPTEVFQGEKTVRTSSCGRHDSHRHSQEIFGARELCVTVPASTVKDDEEWRGTEKDYVRRVGRRRKPGSCRALITNEGQLFSSHPLFFNPAFRRFCTAAVSGLCGGNTNVLMEHVMKVWHEETWENLFHYKFFILLLLLGGMAVGQLLFLNVGLARYEALYVVPTTMSVLIVSSCFAEIALFINVLHMPQTEFLLFAGGCFSIVVGIMILSSASVERFEAREARADNKGVSVDVEEVELSSVCSSSVDSTSGRLNDGEDDSVPQEFRQVFAALEMETEVHAQTAYRHHTVSFPAPDTLYDLPHREKTDGGGDRQETACNQEGNADRRRKEAEKKQINEKGRARDTQRLKNGLEGQAHRSTTKPPGQGIEGERGEQIYGTSSLLSHRFLPPAWTLRFSLSSERRRKAKGYVYLSDVPPLPEGVGCFGYQQVSAENSTRAVSSASLEASSFSESSRQGAEGENNRDHSFPRFPQDRQGVNPHLIAASETLREYAHHRHAVCCLHERDPRPKSAALSENSSDPDREASSVSGRDSSSVSERESSSVS